MSPFLPRKLAVLVPCYNEGTTIAKVVADFRAALPAATIHVYDNNSSDRTAAIAREHGAIVRSELLQGKGNVVRRMFADVDADIYILVDGDDTYHAPSAPMMIERLIAENLDMVNGVRVSDAQEAYRPGHRLGNKLLTGMVSMIFGNRVTDMLSGYRVLSRRFAKSFPAQSSGFEIETELTVHALEMRMAMSEVATAYAARPEGSMSKLNTYRDGMRILHTIANLIREERPLAFFASLGGLLFLSAILLVMPLVAEYVATGLVPRLPTAVLATGMVLFGMILVSCGLILDTVSRGRREAKRLHYLSLPAPSSLADPSGPG